MNDAVERPRVLLVDDDAQLDVGLVLGLEQSSFTVDWARDARSAQAHLQHAHYHIVLLDLQLPDSSGLSVLSSLRRAGSDVLVLVITARDSVEDRVDGLDLGADDYLVKPFDVKELLARIRALLRRRYGGVEAVWQKGAVTVHPAARTAYVGDEAVDVPKREFSLLLLLIENRGRVVTRGVIESSLYALGSEVESNTVEVYVHNLRKRLGRDLIRTVRGVGYVVDSD